MVDYARLKACYLKNTSATSIFLQEKKQEKTFSVPGSDEAGGNCGAPGPPGHAGQVVLDVHVGLDV